MVAYGPLSAPPPATARQQESPGEGEGSKSSLLGKMWSKVALGKPVPLLSRKGREGKQQRGIVMGDLELSVYKRGCMGPFGKPLLSRMGGTGKRGKGQRGNSKGCTSGVVGNGCEVP